LEANPFSPGSLDRGVVPGVVFADLFELEELLRSNDDDNDVLLNFGLGCRPRLDQINDKHGEKIRPDHFFPDSSSFTSLTNHDFWSDIQGSALIGLP
jgi:hypothetical protein